MSKIEKMFENAGIEKMCEFKGHCSGSNCSECPENKLPIFTAEKQLELIKWLLEKWIDVRFVHNLDGIYYISSFNNVSYIEKNLEECIASFVNNAWQDLTESEKEEIRGILNG